MKRLLFLVLVFNSIICNAQTLTLKELFLILDMSKEQTHFFVDTKKWTFYKYEDDEIPGDSGTLKFGYNVKFSNNLEIDYADAWLAKDNDFVKYEFFKKEILDDIKNNISGQKMVLVNQVKEQDGTFVETYKKDFKQVLIITSKPYGADKYTVYVRYKKE